MLHRRFAGEARRKVVGVVLCVAVALMVSTNAPGSARADDQFELTGGNAISTGSSGGGGLPATGTNVVVLSLIGCVLVLAGFVLLGQHRRVREPG